MPLAPLPNVIKNSVCRIDTCALRAKLPWLRSTDLENIIKKTFYFEMISDFRKVANIVSICPLFTFVQHNVI
jgi:hypothetical protein